MKSMDKLFRTIVSVFAVIGLSAVTPTWAQEDVLTSDIELSMQLSQGGFLRGRAPVDETVTVNGQPVSRNDSGDFFIGLDRAAAARLDFISSGANAKYQFKASIPRRIYESGVSITGLSKAIGEADDPVGHDNLFPSAAEIDEDIARALGPAKTLGEASELREKIQSESARKATAFASDAQTTGFLQDWIMPIRVPYRVSSTWGASRTYAGKTTPHGGVDLAAPTGTEIFAPADGVVSLADADFYYEGGVVFIDHGLGLTSIYLHMSEVNVAEGQQIRQGDLLGSVGAKGRATGPHLCWRLHWNGRAVSMDPQSLVGPDEN